LPFLLDSGRLRGISVADSITYCAGDVHFFAFAADNGAAEEGRAFAERFGVS